METENVQIDEQSRAASMIEDVYNDGEAEMPSGRKYQFLKMNHKTRLSIFGFAMKVQNQLKAQDMSFVGSDDWAAIEKLINKHVSCNDSVLSVSNHWDNVDHESDYLMFMTMALSVFSFPFMKGRNRN